MKQILLGIAALGVSTAVGAGISQITPQTARADHSPAKETVSISHRSSLRQNVSSDGLQVLESHTVAPGVETRVVKDRYGRIYRDIVRNGIATPPPERLHQRTNAPSTSASLYESFEAWNGELDWIPEDWTEINTDGNRPTEEMALYYINNTWHGGWTGDGYWTDITKDGEKECFIHFTYNAEYTDDYGNKVEIPATPQDEWLISPTFTVLENQKLFFELEIDLGTIYHFDWSTREYDRTDVECNIEVLISEDSGENWKEIWSAEKDMVSGLSDSEMYAEYATLRYRSVAVDINEYTGKEVQLAFRYINVSKQDMLCGNSMAIDAVTVDTPMVEAFYSVPRGSLLNGFTESLNAYEIPYSVMPAYTDIEWTSASNMYTETNTWSFYNVESGDMSDIIEGNTVSVAYPWSHGVTYPFPSLTASNDFDSKTYSFDEKGKGGIIYGGSMPEFDGEPFGLVNADYAHKSLIASELSDYGANEKSYCFGTHREGIWGDDVTQISIGNLFYKPLAPLSVDAVMVTLARLEADADAEFTMNIYEVDDYGYIARNELISAKAKAGDATTIDGFSNLVFNLDETFVVDQKVLVEITGFHSDKVKAFAACTQYFHNEMADNTAYMRFQLPYKGEITDVWNAASDVLQDYSNSLYIGFIGAFNVMAPEKDKVYLPKDGGSKTVRVESNVAPDKWSVSTDCDWLSAEVRQNGDDCIVTISAPVSSLESREGTVTLSIPGSEAVINIVQGTDAGIDNVTATTKPTARFVGDNILVSDVEAGSAVCIVSADGRILAKGIADSLGNATLDVSAGKGVFIVTTTRGNVRIIR